MLFFFVNAVVFWLDQVQMWAKVGAVFPSTVRTRSARDNSAVSSRVKALESGFVNLLMRGQKVLSGASRHGHGSREGCSGCFLFSRWGGRFADEFASGVRRIAGRASEDARGRSSQDLGTDAHPNLDVHETRKRGSE